MFTYLGAQYKTLDSFNFRNLKLIDPTLAQASFDLGTKAQRHAQNARIKASFVISTAEAVLDFTDINGDTLNLHFALPKGKNDLGIALSYAIEFEIPLEVR